MLLLLISSLAYADPAVVNLQKGQTAPFSGSLLNDEAVAAIIADKKSAIEKCDIEKDLIKKTTMAQHDSKTSILGQKITSCELSLNELETDNKKITSKYNGLKSALPYITIGSFAGGIAFTILIAATINGSVQ